MKRSIFLYSLVLAIPLSASSWFGKSLEKRIEGQWLRGTQKLTMKSGVISMTDSGIVFGSYSVLDEQSIRFIHRKKDGIDTVLIVKFPDDNTMLWNRKSGATLLSFTRQVTQ
jgi:hypothetical protein